MFAFDRLILLACVVVCWTADPSLVTGHGSGVPEAQAESIAQIAGYIFLVGWMLTGVVRDAVERLEKNK